MPGGEVNVLERIAGWKPPALVLHGTADGAIPVSQAHNFETALLAAGATVEATTTRVPGTTSRATSPSTPTSKDASPRSCAIGSPVPREAPRVKSAPAPPKVGSFADAVTRRTLADEDEWSGDLVTGVDLNGVVAEHARLIGCELRDVKFTGAELHRCVLTDVRFVDCELSGAMLTESSWLRVELRNCRMSGLVVSQSQLRDVRFTARQARRR